jgi:hypothetical protein
MDDIVDEKYEWEMDEEDVGEESLVGEVAMDWGLAEELMEIDRGDAPPQPVYPICIERDGKLM